MQTVIFLGSPQTAVASLEALAGFPGCRVSAVVTQPPRPVGRGRTLRPGPVWVAAERLGIPVYTPESFGGAEGLALLRDSQAELAVVCAYGRILSRELLQALPLGWYNLHFSLLPRWRGASPLQAAILAGDAVTGVSLQQIVPKLDAGPIAAETPPIPIDPRETAESLGEKLAASAAGLLSATLPGLLNGNPPLREQDPEQVTMCRIIRKNAGAVDWENETAVEIDRKARAYFPWPGCHGFLGGRRVGLVRLEEATPPEFPMQGDEQGQPLPGVLLPGGLVRAREGFVRLLEVKPEGKGAMPLKAFLNGAPGLVGERFSPTPSQ